LSLQKVQGYDYWNPTLWEFSFEDNPDIRFLVKTITLPFIQLQAETYNSGHKYLTEYTPEEEFTIEFLETKDFDVMDYLNEWFDSIFDKTWRTFKRGNHTKNGLLHLQGFKNNAPIINAFNRLAVYETVKAFDFKNMLILGIDDIDLDYESGEGKKISARFTADSVDEEVPFVSNSLPGPLDVR